MNSKSIMGPYQISNSHVYAITGCGFNYQWWFKCANYCMHVWMNTHCLQLPSTIWAIIRFSVLHSDTTTTHVTYSPDQSVVNNVQLLNQSAIPTITAYENLLADDEINVNQEDFMTKENFQELERKRFSVLKKWTSSNTGVLEITPDYEP